MCWPIPLKNDKYLWYVIWDDLHKYCSQYGYGTGSVYAGAYFQGLAHTAGFRTGWGDLMGYYRWGN